MPIILLSSKLEVLYANPAAEQFFDTGLTLLRKQTLADLMAQHSPLFKRVGKCENLFSDVRCCGRGRPSPGDLAAPPHYT